MLYRITRTPLTIALALLASVGCSNVPPTSLPASLTLRVEVHYDVPEGRTAPVELPMSGPSLTILDLETDPADLLETYSDRRRLLHLPEGPATVVVRCHYRIYQEPDSRFLTAAELFPGNTAIRVIDAGR